MILVTIDFTLKAGVLNYIYSIMLFFSLNVHYAYRSLPGISRISLIHSGAFFCSHTIYFSLVFYFRLFYKSCKHLDARYNIDHGGY